MALRLAGRTYDEIAAELGVSKSSCSRWLRDLPHPARRPEAEARRRAGRRRYWDGILAEREADRDRAHAVSAGGVGPVSFRELELLAVTAYWCEGTKDKPYARREHVEFVNSDPGLIRVFLSYVDAVGFPRELRRFRVSIHESADLAAATQVWADVTGVPPDAFQTPTLKRHNPLTPRRNTGEAYVGCVVVRLLRSRELYQRISGVWQGIVAGTGPRSWDADGQSALV